MSFPSAPTPSRGLRPSAFTLIELLVTIGILAVLVSILLPVMGNVSERGRAVTCLNNMKQLSTALILYAADNNEYIPCVQNDGDNPSGTDWVGAVYPYIELKNIPANTRGQRFYCPTFFARYKNNSAYNPQMNGYGMNYSLYRSVGDNNINAGQHRQKLSVVPNHSTTVIFGESTNAKLKSNTTTGYFNKDAGQMEGWAAGGQGGTPDRHNGRSNYIFLDGHVQAATPTEAAVFLKLQTATP